MVVGMVVMQVQADQVVAQQDMQQQLPEQAQLDKDLQVAPVQENPLDIRPAAAAEQVVLGSLE
jgi:hypothetical protein